MWLSLLILVLTLVSCLLFLVSCFYFLCSMLYVLFSSFIECKNFWNIVISYGDKHILPFLVSQPVDVLYLPFDKKTRSWIGSPFKFPFPTAQEQAAIIGVELRKLWLKAIIVAP